MTFAAEIAQELGGRMEALAAALLPLGRRDGQLWIEGRRADGGLGDSLKVDFRRRRWRHYAAGVGGDALDLVAYARFGSLEAKREAIAWARDWLGRRGDAGPGPAERASAWSAADEARRATADPGNMRKAALKVYLGASALRDGDPVWRYCRGRGMDLAALERAPRALRFHPALWNREAGAELTGMVAAISDQDGNHVSTHRTWLATRQDGSVVKAPLREPKMSLGSYAGGCIRLWNGAGNAPLRKAPAGSRAVIAEGIEDGLSWPFLFGAQDRVLVAVSLANLGALWLPEAIAEVVIAAQNDEGNAAAAAALARAAARFQAQGRRVQVLRPPVYVKDWNDLLQRQMKENAA